jgi:hypothetical protein
MTVVTSAGQFKHAAEPAAAMVLAGVESRGTRPLGALLLWSCTIQGMRIGGRLTVDMHRARPPGSGGAYGRNSGDFGGRRELAGRRHADHPGGRTEAVKVAARGLSGLLAHGPSRCGMRTGWRRGRQLGRWQSWSGCALAGGE